MAEENIDEGLTTDEFELAFAAAAGGDSVDQKDDVDVSAATSEGKDTGTADTGENDASTGSTEEVGTTELAGIDEGSGGTEEVDVKPEILPEKKEAPAKKESPAIDPAVVLAEKQAREKAEADALAAAEAREKPTAEEEELLKGVTEVFPDVVKVLAVQERILTAKFENQVAKTIKDLEARFEQRIAPAENVFQQVARTAHEAEILRAHPDAFTVLPKVEAWVETLPQFLQKTYNEVLDRGTSSDIVALYDIFKTQTGSAHSSSPTPEEIAQQKADALKAEAEKAAKNKKLKSMEQVKGRQAAQKGGIDEDDFESAFNAAANS